MKVTHKIWPVSYQNDDGDTIYCIYTFDPSTVRDFYGVGLPVDIELEHVAPSLTKKQQIQADIERMQAKLEHVAPSLLTKKQQIQADIERMQAKLEAMGDE